jgi:cytochrome c553
MAFTRERRTDVKSFLCICAVCEGRELDASTYDAPVLATGLPALACRDCGNLQLDDRRAGRIAEIVGVPALSRMRGADLRAEVRRWLSALQPVDQQQGAARIRFLSSASCRNVN